MNRKKLRESDPFAAHEIARKRAVRRQAIWTAVYVLTLVAMVMAAYAYHVLEFGNA